MKNLNYLLLPLLLLVSGSQFGQVYAEGTEPVVDANVAEVITSAGVRKTYTSLVDAFKGVSNNCKVNLLQDVYVGAEDTTTARVGINSRSNVVNFDFNGHEILYNGTKENSNNFMGIYLQSATLKVYATNGGGMRKLDSSNSGSFYCFHVQGPTNYTYAKLEIYGGNFVGYPTAVNMQKGSATIYGGTFSSGTSETRYVLNRTEKSTASSAKIIVAGGDFVDFNPANNASDGEGTSYMKEGYSAYSYEKEGKQVYRALNTMDISYLDGNYSTDLGMRILLKQESLNIYRDLGYTLTLKTKKALYSGDEVVNYEEVATNFLDYTSTVNEAVYEVAGFNGIKFYEMTSEITCSLVAVDPTGIELTTDTITVTYANYAKKAMEQYQGQEDKQTKIEIIKQLLILGGLAQTDMNYHMSDLASSYVPAA